MASGAEHNVFALEAAEDLNLDPSSLASVAASDVRNGRGAFVTGGAPSMLLVARCREGEAYRPWQCNHFIVFLAMRKRWNRVCQTSNASNGFAVSEVAKVSDLAYNRIAGTPATPGMERTRDRISRLEGLSLKNFVGRAFAFSDLPSGAPSWSTAAEIAALGGVAGGN